MKAYVIKENNRLYVKRVKGFTPDNVLCEVPEDIAKADYGFLKEENGTVVVDTEAKSAWIQEQIDGAVSE